MYLQMLHCLGHRASIFPLIELSFPFVGLLMQSFISNGGQFRRYFMQPKMNEQSIDTNGNKTFSRF